MSNDIHVLGIDAGGTRVVCLLADGNGNVLGRGVGGSANYQAVGVAAAVAAVRDAVHQAWQAAGLAPATAAAAFLGMAGVDRPRDRDTMLAALAPLRLAEHIAIANDAVVALAAGSPRREGLVAVAGTGSIVWGRNSRGEERRAGGWGYILGDEGSAFDIGMKALRAVVRAHDGRANATLLAELILQAWHLSKPEDLISALSTPTYPRLQMAGLAPLVAEAAHRGDQVARDIYHQAAHELALASSAVIKGLGMERDAVDIVLSGGVWQAGDLLTGPFLEAVRSTAPLAQVIRLVTEPAVGAVRLALQELANEKHT